MGWQHWRVILSVSDLAPNVGMWWYFFTEMFDHFRAFFLGVFQVRCALAVLIQLHTLIYVAPVCIRLRHQPLFATLILVGVISTWKSYPTLGDLGLWAGLLGCFPEVVKGESIFGKANQNCGIHYSPPPSTSTRSSFSHCSTRYGF
jgi:phosphatidylinositol glycan class U